MVIDGCRFETDRLLVGPWHEELDENACAALVDELLTPAVTAGLPPDWAGAYDTTRSTRWIRDRDAGSELMLVRDRASREPIGLLIVSDVGSADEPVESMIGYLLAEEHWGRGLASELVGGLVVWARSHGGIAALAAGVADDNPASARVLTRHGFAPVADGPAENRPTSERRFRLSLPTNDGVVVRPETVADHADVRDVVTSAFGSPAEAELVDRIRSSPEYRPELALVAEVAGSVTGHVMISGAIIRTGQVARPIVMLSPLAVAPGHQRRGIGAALVRAVVAAADDGGEPLVVVEGDPTYYGRFGFEPSTRYDLVLPLPEWAPSAAGQVKLLSSHDPLDPTLSGEVEYPPAFDGLD